MPVRDSGRGNLMTVAGHRHERVAGEMQHEIGSMVAGELKDPRLAVLVTVTEVRAVARYEAGARVRQRRRRRGRTGSRAQGT